MPISLATLATLNRLETKQFELQYKDFISGYHQWEQKEHAEEWLLFEANLGTKLSIDEVDLSNGELYTILTNKEKHGQKGCLVAMAEGVKSDEIANILAKISLQDRLKVLEVTADLSESMEAIIRKSFPKAIIVTDRFHVQQLITEAVQEVRIDFRWKAIKEENQKIKEAKEQGLPYRPIIYENGDTKKQLLARSRYLLFKPQSKWTERQAERAKILFREYPEIEHAYNLSMYFRNCYETSANIEEAKTNLQQWYQKIKEEDLEPFITAAESIRWHETTILNYFLNRSTNASAESFNAKLKNFRTVVRGVRDLSFHLFRVAMLYA